MSNAILNYIDSFYVFVSDLLTLDELPELSLDDKIETACAYSDGKVLINFDKFPKDNSLFLFMALAHELRHAYQVQCLESDEQDYFSEEQLDLIQNELSNYIPHGNNYKNQFIELDAFGFAEFIINTCFGIKCTYNQTFTQEEIDKIHNKANEFKNIYSDDEVKECMQFAEFEPIKKDFS